MVEDIEMNMKNQTLKIKNSLEQMQQSGKVDLAILDDIITLNETLKTIKGKWFEIADSNGFYFYQATRNVELILGKMEHRFTNSHEAKEPLKIIQDSLMVLSHMDDVLEAIQKFTIKPQMVNDVLQKTYSLRDKAIDVNLLESLEVSREGINRDNLRSQIPKLLQKLT